MDPKLAAIVESYTRQPVPEQGLQPSDIHRLSVFSSIVQSALADYYIWRSAN